MSRFAAGFIVSYNRSKKKRRDASSVDRPKDCALTPEAKEYILFQEQQIADLTNQLNYLRKLYFGKKSEKQPLSIPAECDQLSIFDEAEATADSKTEDLPRETNVTVREYTRAKRRSREEVLGGLPTEVHEYDLAPENTGCPHCGHEMEKVGREFVRKECEYIPAHVKVHEYYCATYTCRDCLGGGEGCPDCHKPAEACKDCKDGPRTVFVKAPLPPEKRYPVFAHSLASASTVAYVLYAKYVQAIPLYRQVKDWEMAGLTITRATLANWVVLCHRDYFEHLVAYLRRILLASDILHSDETPVNVLDEKNRVNSQMWVYRTGACQAHPIVIYDYQPSREAKHPKRFLEGFGGYLVTDGMAGYPTLKTVTNCGCWAHVRREFLKAAGGKSPAEGTGLRKGFDLIEALFMLERDYCDLSPDARLDERRKRSKPILDEFWQWCASGNRLKSDPCSKPIGYATGQKQALCAFLLDGRIPISNNDAENAIRPFVVGRKNWLFCNTTNGAQASASAYSIVETAKANGLNPYQYFKFLLERMPSANRSYSDAFLTDLMPWCNDVQRLCR